MEEARELAALVMSNKVNYRASNTRLRYQLVLSALVFCLGATYGVKELKIPGVLTFVSSPNAILILSAILGFSVFTLFSFGTQHSLYRFEDPDERKEINEYRRWVDKEVSSIKAHFHSAKEKLGLSIEAYSNLPAEKPNRVFFTDEEPKPVDPNLTEVEKLTGELKSVYLHAKKIEDENFLWEEFFSGKGAPNKIFLADCINVKSASRELADNLNDRRIGEAKIRPAFDKFSHHVWKLEVRHKKFQKTLKSFSDARWLDRYGLPFLFPLFVWAFLIMVGVVNFIAQANWNSCASDKQLTAVYNYSNFGPQGLAGELLGPEWWQWNHHSDSDSSTTDDIKVVVYAYGGKEVAMTHYVVHPPSETDYRYVSYSSAINFLDEKAQELDAMTIEKDAVTFPALSKQLKNTLKLIETKVCDNS